MSGPDTAAWWQGEKLDALVALLPSPPQDRGGLAADLARIFRAYEAGAAVQDWPAPSRLRDLLEQVAKHASELATTFSGMTAGESTAVQQCLGIAAENYAAAADEKARSALEPGEWDFADRGPCLVLEGFEPGPLPGGGWHYGGHAAMQNGLSLFRLLARLVPEARKIAVDNMEASKIASHDAVDHNEDSGAAVPKHRGNVARRFWVREMAGLFTRLTGQQVPRPRTSGEGGGFLPDWQPFLRFAAAAGKAAGVKVTERTVRLALKADPDRLNLHRGPIRQT